MSNYKVKHTCTDSTYNDRRYEFKYYHLTSRMYVTLCTKALTIYYFFVHNVKM